MGYIGKLDTGNNGLIPDSHSRWQPPVVREVQKTKAKWVTSPEGGQQQV